MPPDFEHSNDGVANARSPSPAHIAEEGHVHRLNEHLAGAA